MRMRRWIRGPERSHRADSRRARRSSGPSRMPDILGEPKRWNSSTLISGFSRGPPRRGKLQSRFADRGDGRSMARAVVNGVREPVLLLDRELRVLAANEAYCLAFNTELQGRARPSGLGRQRRPLGLARGGGDARGNTGSNRQGSTPSKWSRTCPARAGTRSCCTHVSPAKKSGTAGSYSWQSRTCRNNAPPSGNRHDCCKRWRPCCWRTSIKSRTACRSSRASFSSRQGRCNRGRPGRTSRMSTGGSCRW